VKILQKSAVAWSLECFGNDLICWQLISVRAAKRLPCLPFYPKAAKRLRVSTFWDLKFPPKPHGNRGNRPGETTRKPAFSRSTLQGLHISQ